MVLLTSFSLPKKYEDSKSVVNTIIDKTSLVLDQVQRARKLRELDREIQRDKEIYLRLKQGLLEKKKKQSSGRLAASSTGGVEIFDTNTAICKKRKAAFNAVETPPAKVLKLDDLVERSLKESREAGELIREIEEFLGETRLFLGRVFLNHTIHQPQTGECMEDNNIVNMEARANFSSDIQTITEHVGHSSVVNSNNNCGIEIVKSLGTVPQTPKIKLSSKPAPTSCEPPAETKKKKFKFVPVSFP